MKERIGLMAELERGERTMSELCRVFGVSRKTGYKWWARYRERGVTGLEDQSRAPHTRPDVVGEPVKAALLELRARHPDWGPVKLLDWLRPRYPDWVLPVPSTVALLLARRGLVKPRRSSRNRTPYGAPFVVAVAPNELWSADFKGQFRTGDGRYCYPLTISDAYSRFLLCCRGLHQPRFRQVLPWFERVFRDYGLPTAIRTDNGAPFASAALGGISRLSLWWLKLGIIPERIRPGQPQQNARHERLHGTLKRACAVQASLLCQQRAFERFRRDYNTERPHQALKGHTPSMHYNRSPRPFPSRLPELAYPTGYEQRRVMPSGSIGWVGRKWYVAGVLAGETIGLYPVDDGVWRVHVGPLALGTLDARNKRIDPIETIIKIPTIH
jgi:transposase InsO family protein